MGNKIATRRWHIVMHRLNKGQAAARTWLHRHRRSLRIAMRIVVIVVGCVVALQLAYPPDRALPFLRIGGISIGLQDRQQITRALDEFMHKGQTTIKTPSKSWHTTWQSVGLNVDREASIEASLQYSWWERLLPFSAVARILSSQHSPIVALVDQDRLHEFAAKVAAEDKAAAQNATITVAEGVVQIDEAKNGYRFEVQEIERQIRAMPMIAGATVELVPQTVSYVRSEAELHTIAQQAESMLARPIALQVGDKTYQPARPVVGQWLTFAEDPTSHHLVVHINQEAIRAYLGTIDKEVAMQPGTSQVTLLDGLEVARTAAGPGRAVAVDESVKTIEAILRGEREPTVQLPLADVPPKIEFSKTYSQASSGLQALIQDWEQSNYGDYGIIIRELTGSHRYAEWQPDKPFVTASTYKMFVVYTVLTKIQQGVITRDQPTGMGWSVHDCMVEVIVNSTNPCAVALQNLLGWEVVDNMLHEAGFTSTHLNNRLGGDKQSTIRDETNFLLKLQSGTLMNPSDTDFLLGLMKRQIWRAGIPRGVPYGTVVADKVGLYGSWVHDVALVYSPKATYILGIMSRGGSDPQFADLSERVYNFFNQ